MTDDRQKDEFLKLTTTLGAGKFVLVELRGEERLSELFRYELELFSSDDTVAFDSLVGSSATVTIQGVDGPQRYVNGLITRFSMLRIDPLSRNAVFQAELRPWLWMLGLQADSRIFQSKTVPDILKAVFDEAGYTDYQFSTQDSFTAREYCVQYRETNLNFVLRLMEEEGLFCFFKHEDGKHTLVIGNDADAHPDCSAPTTLKFRANVADHVEDGTISEVMLDRRVVSGAYGVNSFHFETPSTALYTKATGTRTQLAINDYPTWHTTTADGEKIAKRRLEAIEVQAELLRGGGTLRNLVAGHKFTLQGHSRSELNAAYVLHSVTIRAARDDYRADFVAFPATVPFRPMGTAQKPTIPSTQTAIVVGKQGEEQWVDKYGRVKVQFHWDRLGQKDENSSCWVRVAQGWAGKSWGMMFLPRIGQEVVISFLEGDPDRPLITGVVYNAEQTVPYELPAEQTKSTVKSQSTKNGSGKFNEIRFEDKADSEEIYVHAQKDYNLEVLNDVTRTIKHDETVTVENDAKLTINHDNTITVKNDRTRTVSEGNDELKVETGTRKVTVKGKETHTNNDDFEHTVDKNYKLTVSGNLTIEVTGDLTIKAKSIDMQSSSADVTVKSAAALNAESGTALAVKAGTSAEVKSGTSLAVKSGTGMEVKAGLGMKLESSTTLDIKATASLKAEGLTVGLKGSAMGEVDGGGMLTVKGGLVKIN